MLSKEEVMRGMQLKPDVEARFEFVGYRKNNLYEGYRPVHLIYEDCLTTGVHSYYNLENNAKGELKGTITFVSPEDYPACLLIGKQITMYEGKNVVGHATITNILIPYFVSLKKKSRHPTFSSTNSKYPCYNGMQQGVLRG